MTSGYLDNKHFWIVRGITAFSHKPLFSEEYSADSILAKPDFHFGTSAVALAVGLRMSPRVKLPIGE